MHTDNMFSILLHLYKDRRVEMVTIFPNGAIPEQLYLTLFPFMYFNYTWSHVQILIQCPQCLKAIFLTPCEVKESSSQKSTSWNKG
jgi:hypothetical protein